MAGKKKKGGATFKRKPKAAVNPDMNVTPLVDVVLVLLIIFMVMAPVVNAHYVGRLPPPDDKDEAIAEANPDNKPLVLRVEGGASEDDPVVFKLGSEVLEFEDAPTRLGRIISGRPDKVVYVDSSDETPYGEVLQAMSFATDSEDVVNQLVAEKLGKPQGELPRIRVTAVLVTKEIPAD